MNSNDCIEGAIACATFSICWAMKFPIAIEPIHKPISTLTIPAGESLVTIESPTGDMHNSAHVWMQYTASNHAADTLTISPSGPKVRLYA